MAIEVGNMTNKAPLGIVENILVKNDNFLFYSDFVVIDMLETILLGRAFLAMIQARIDFFRGEISLGVGFKKVKFDINEEICHSRVPLENIYMSVDIVDSSSDSEGNVVGSHLSEIVSRWHVCKPFHITFKVCEEDYRIWPTCNPNLSFCSGGNGMKFDDFFKVMYGNKNIDDEWVKEEFNFGVNIGRTKDDPYSRNFDEYKDESDKEIDQLENEYELKAGRKRYALEEVWEKCEKFHDSTKRWYDEGFKEKELWQNGIEKIDYIPPLAKNDTVDVHVTHSKMGKVSYA
nr:hypothetical protein [Tanacetum cinerariifolium]